MRWQSQGRRLVAFLAVAGTVVAVSAAASAAGPSVAGVRHGSSNPEEAGPGQPPPGGYLRLKENSGRPVTAAEVARARQQAARIPVGDPAPWRFTGPTNIAGRVVDLAVDPTTSPSTVYAAVSSGGIMKSTDGGTTWSPAWPSSDPQAMGALARGPDGTLWAGTGEANPSGGGLTFFGNGIYKSVNGGRSWQHMGLPGSAAFGRIVVNPRNPNEVWAAAAGSISWTATQRGLYHTTNGGRTWARALAPPNDTTGAIDVALDPANPQIILAALWDHHRNNGGWNYGGTGSGLYRSTDDGRTWTRLGNSGITGGLCSWDQAQTGLNTDPSLGRIGIAFAPSDPNRAYIDVTTGLGPDKGFYVSDDAGQTWRCSGGEPGTDNAGYEWVYGRVWVDPTNPDHVFDADLNLVQSTDGGNTWTDSDWTKAVEGATDPVPGQPHADQHAMAWDPNVPGRVYLGNDGGVYRSDSDGADGTWLHGTVEPWTQSYHFAVSQQDPSRMVTGLQDQGSVRTWTPGTEPANLALWNAYGGGDGHWVQINPDNELVYYECLQSSPPSENCARFTDASATGGGGSTRTTFSTPPWPSGTRVTTDTPMVLDPADPNYVYIGGTSIARSGDGVVSGTGAWTIISPPTPDSPDSLPGPVPPSEINLDTYYANEYGAVTEIAPAKSTGTASLPASTIYAGTDTGRLWKTTNATAGNGSDVTWTRLGAGVLPQAWVTSIAVDPANADHAYVSFSNYREGALAANVWETTDGGATWRNISGNLPNAPVESITYDQQRGTLFASSEYGAFFLGNGRKNWARFGTQLPNCPIFDLKLSGDGNTVFAATFGRGIWQMAAPG